VGCVAFLGFIVSGNIFRSVNLQSDRPSMSVHPCSKGRRPIQKNSSLLNLVQGLSFGPDEQRLFNRTDNQGDVLSLDRRNSMLGSIEA
jgi:hypothetical protein